MGSSGHDQSGEEVVVPPEILAAFGHLKGQSDCPEPALLRAASSEVLPAELSASVLQHLEKCPICQALVQDLESLDETRPGDAAVQRLWNRIRSGLEAAPALKPAPRVGTWKFWLRPWPLAALAAAIVVIAAAPTLLRRNPEPSAFVAPSQPAPVAPKPVLVLEKPPILLPASALMVWRGTPDSDHAQWVELQAALRPFQSGDYVSAAAELKRVAAAHPLMVESWFYLGVSELFLGQNEQAVTDLDAARKLSQPALDAEVKWYSAIACERTGRTADERSLLEGLCHGSGKYSAAACRVLGQ